jgi:N-acetylmuramoyl-L-alanine amidase
MFRMVSDDSRSGCFGTRVQWYGSSVPGTRYRVLPLLFLALSAAAYARPHHTEAWARDHFATAERMREALNGRLPADRTRRDYQRVINEYRSVYFGAPTSTKADPSVVAVAETLVEMGRRFDDDKILHEAIAQYKFLRREYPGSKYRSDALFTIAEIYNDDLNDQDQARAAFEEFLHRYPNNRLVEDARQAIADLDREAADHKREAQTKIVKKEQPANTDHGAASGGESVARGNDNAARAEAPGLQMSAPHSSAPQVSAAYTPETDSGSLPRVTGIRHWSTPDYTRVAIDLDGEVKYGSQRISHPDRIFFDLRDTKLASTLVGKTFEVDDGFLKKIRVAQFQPGRTRVVLEVDDLADYEAFLLPDPYRLIIDIHGKNLQARNGLKTPRVKSLAENENDSTSEGNSGENSTVASNSARLKTDPARETKETAPKPDPLRAHVEKTAAGDDASEATETRPSDTSLEDRTVETVAKVGGNASSSTIKKVIVEPDDDDTPPDTDSPPRKGASSSRKSHAKSASRTRQGDQEAADVEVREASPTASGDRSLIRALGLKIGKIVIDPGHGGHDTGTIGPNGLEEKDLVLEVGLKLGKLLESRLGAEVVYTRKDDTFVPLETRTAIANQQRADLFISIHANSSHDPDARGVETYYLNFTSSPDALEVAARENAVSEKSIFELQDLVKKIALKEKIEESHEFAADVQESLHSGLALKSPGIRDRGVKKAPFIVLIGANMPSILAEISFVSNPGDEKRLETSEYRKRIAESLYKGIAKYVNGLSGVKVASKIEKVSGQ